MTAVEKLLNIARNEIGYLEKETNSNLDSKTANAGDRNYTKYARDLDMTDFYSGAKNGYPWCDVFVDWCFIQAFGIKKARELTCQPTGSYGASCSMSASYYKKDGQFHLSDPEPGDQIFFSKNGGKSYYHTGVVEKVEGGRVHTIEGNTSSEPGVVENGGAVRRKSYSLDDPSIGGYGRPDFSLVDDSSSDSTPAPEMSTPVVDSSNTINEIPYTTPKKGKVKAANGLNVRKGPGTNYAKISALANNASVNIIGSSSDNKWLHIDNGWVSAQYISIIDSNNTSPAPTTKPETSQPIKKGKVKAANGLNVRKGPGTKYAKIGGLANNESVNIIGTSSDKKWYQISNGGWVSAQYITLTNTSQPIKKGKVNAVIGLNVRKGPGTKYAKISALSNHTVITIIATSSDKKWYQISNGGWVNAKHVKII